MKLSTYLIAVPTVVVAAVVAIANRQSVIFSLNPFWSNQPSASLSVQMPLFMLLLVTLALGALLGGFAAHLSRMGRERARAKAAKPTKSGLAALPARTGGSKPGEE